MKKELEKLIEKMENYLRWKILLGESSTGKERREIRKIEKAIEIINQDLEWLKSLRVKK